MKEWADRFAEQLLKDNLELEEFQVSLVGYDEYPKIIERLEGLGCKVEVDTTRGRLTVFCPQRNGDKAAFAKTQAKGKQTGGKTAKAKKKPNQSGLGAVPPSASNAIPAELFSAFSSEERANGCSGTS